MLKAPCKFFFILVISILVIFHFPVSLADTYSSYIALHGRSLDRDGNIVPGATVKLYDSENRFVDSTISNARGEFVFDMIHMNQSQEMFKLRASITNGRTWTTETGFFYVYSTVISTQDIIFYDYPPSGVGRLYGIVTSDNYYYTEAQATVYLDNGMFLLYPGNRYDQWSFDQLPQGNYVLWAERNINNVTYTSERYTVTVNSDDNAYMLIHVPVKDPVAYHEQPVPLKNVVRGTIIQNSGEVLPYTKVELYRYQGNTPVLVASTTSDIDGRYLFDDINVNSPTVKFMVRATFDANGVKHSQDSDDFTVYYPNTLNVTHDYDVSINIPYSITGKATIYSDPAGAQIDIDGINTGHVTPYSFPMKTGPHSLGLSMDGYFCDNTTIQVEPDADVTVNRTLKLSTGNLSLEVSPANTQVYIDGALIGTGSLTLAKKPAGEYDYLLVCDGFQSESGTLSILPGESVARKINMVASPGISLTYLAYLISGVFESIGRIF